jgi:hypothetical protein
MDETMTRTGDRDDDLIVPDEPMPFRRVVLKLR